MRITFASNYFSHHQKPLSDALRQLTGGEYRFIATQPVSTERVSLGWEVDSSPSYVSEALDGYLSEDDARWLQSSDVLLFGSAPEALLKGYLAGGGLAFRYSERPLKEGDSALKRIPRWVRWHRRNPACADLYLLSAGAYAASDYARYGLFENRAYEWGYFPPLKTYDDVGSLIAAKQPASLLWCGRFLGWKHPELALHAVRLLKEQGYGVRLTMIGAGPMETDLRQMVQTYGLQANVAILPPRANVEVRRLMEQHQVFLFTSGGQEGWGAVLNEAMNSACAIVASEMAGSTPYLIRNGENGLVCSELSAEAYSDRIAQLLDSDAQRESLSAAAYQTVTDLWNAQVAGRRLMALSTAILGGKVSPDLFDDGPCSKANRSE